MFVNSLILSIIISLSLAQISPYEEGPYQTIFNEILQANIDEIDHSLGVYTPNEPGKFPVVYFTLGLFGM